MRIARIGLEITSQGLNDHPKKKKRPQFNFFLFARKLLCAFPYPYLGIA